MDMYAPITITSRVELFRKNNARFWSEIFSPVNGDVHSNNANSSGLQLANLAFNNGFNANRVNKPEKQLHTGTNGSKIKALHVEDDEEIRFLVKAFLKNYVDVDSVADGVEALDQTSVNKYDLIITDINLGDGINGIEASRKIRDMMHYRNVPIIAATANAGADIRNECIEVGMDAFLLKPFMKKDLINTIEQVLDSRQ